MDIITKSTKLNNKKLENIKKDNKVYKIVINNKRYIFKPAPKENGIPSYESCFNEIVVSYLAKYLDINCIDVSMASYNETTNRFKEEYGILMEDYNLDGYIAFFGSYFLEIYYDYLKKNNKLSTLNLENVDKEEALIKMNNFKTIIKMNNFKTIYIALLYYFNDFDNKDFIVTNIIKELSKMICLDYLTMQSDRHMENWGILLSNDKAPILIKMYDNELAFDTSFVPRLKTLSGDETKEEALINFVNLNESFKNQFLDLYNKLDVETFINIIDEIELENGNFPNSNKKYKDNLIEAYQKNYEDIARILRIERSDKYAR